MRLRLLALILTSVALLAAAPSVRTRVDLVVLGDFPRPLVDAVSHKLVDELQVDVRELPATSLPALAWYPPRARWRADKLIDWLPAQRPPGDDARVLGLTTADISTTKDAYPDWGVFGLGAMSGYGAVMSTFRLGNGASPALLKFRVESVAAHEVGHMLGLPHCTEKGCLMLDAEGGIRNTDSGTGHLGERCRAQLEDALPTR